jgi:hypothetical protein
VFAEAEYQQGRARMYTAQADLLTQQAIAAMIANGLPEPAAWVNAGYRQAEVDGWFSDTKAQENSLSRKVAMFQQITQGLQQLGLAKGMDIITEEAAQQIVTTLFGELLPEVPAAMFEIEDDEPEDAPGLPQLPPGSQFQRAPEEGPGLPAGFAQQLPPGTPAMNPIPAQDR